jgi:hypothetical protein
VILAKKRRKKGWSSHQGQRRIEEDWESSLVGSSEVGRHSDTLDGRRETEELGGSRVCKKRGARWVSLADEKLVV